jgi:hypothetical protein
MVCALSKMKMLSNKSQETGLKSKRGIIKAIQKKHPDYTIEKIEDIFKNLESMGVIEMGNGKLMVLKNDFGDFKKPVEAKKVKTDILDKNELKNLVAGYWFLGDRLELLAYKLLNFKTSAYKGWIIMTNNALIDFMSIHNDKAKKIIEKDVINKKRDYRTFLKNKGVTHELLKKSENRKFIVLRLHPQYPGDIAKFYRINTEADFEKYIDAAALEPNMKEIKRVHEYLIKYNGIINRKISYNEYGNVDVNLQRALLELSVSASKDLQIHLYTVVRAMQHIFGNLILVTCGNEKCELRSKQLKEYEKNFKV